MPEPERADVVYATVERLLQERKYEQAIALLCERVDSVPTDRTARLFLLLANVLVFGPVPFEKQIDDLQSHFDLTEIDRNIVRLIFLAAFHDAEKTGQKAKQQTYQRLLREQILGLPHDLSITEASPSQFTMEAAATDAASEPGPVSAPLRPEWACHPPPSPPRGMRRKARHAMIGSTAIISLLLLGFYVASGRRNSPEQVQLASWTAIAPNPVNSAPTPQATSPLVALSTNFDSEQGQVKTNPTATRPTSLRPHTNYLLEAASPLGESAHQMAKRTIAETADPSILESETWLSVKLKDKPKFAAETLEQVSSGTRVVVLQKEQDWLRVRVKHSGNVGYMRKEYLIALTSAP